MVVVLLRVGGGLFLGVRGPSLSYTRPVLSQLASVPSAPAVGVFGGGFLLPLSEKDSSQDFPLVSLSNLRPVYFCGFLSRDDGVLSQPPSFSGKSFRRTSGNAARQGRTAGIRFS